MQQSQPRNRLFLPRPSRALSAPLRLRVALACTKLSRRGAAPTPPRHCPRPDGQSILSLVSTRREPAVRNTLILILVLNALVAGVKIVVGLRTNALSVLGASLESALDVLNNIVGIALVASRRRSRTRIIPTAIRSSRRSARSPSSASSRSPASSCCARACGISIVSEHPVFPSLMELSLIAATMFVNVLVVWYERRRARQLNSDFLLADAAHTRSDIYVTAAAFMSLVLARRGYGAFDAILAIGVALLIAWNGYQIVRHTVPVLVDERGVDAGVLRRVVGAIPNVVDVRTVRSRAISSRRALRRGDDRCGWLDDGRASTSHCGYRRGQNLERARRRRSARARRACVMGLQRIESHLAYC